MVICRLFGDRFHCELGNMSAISRLKGMSISGVKGYSGIPYRRLHPTFANVNIISQNNRHYTIVRGIRNIEKRGTDSEVVDGDERTNKYARRTTSTGRQIVKHIDCEEDQWGEFVFGDYDEELSDDERQTFNTILEKSRHRDGSIYKVDTWWKELFRIADRNESK